MSPKSFVVEVESMVKTFGSFVAVDHISFKVEAGQIFGFLGPNGSGKSTTIRMLCGILMPTSGKAKVLGYLMSSGSQSGLKKRSATCLRSSLSTTILP